MKEKKDEGFLYIATWEYNFYKNTHSISKRYEIIQLQDIENKLVFFQVKRILKLKLEYNNEKK